jgi:DNA-binding XRE family transcriptional regulator
MIKNEKQYRITKNQIKKFNEALEVVRETQKNEDPLLLKLQIDSIESQIESLEKEIKEYEELKEGKVSKMTLDIKELSSGIINARIVKGYNHKQLVDLLGVSEQQIQKYESEDYCNTSLKRLIEIISILEIEAEAKFDFHQKKAFGFMIPEGVDMVSIKESVRERGVPVKICA